MLYLQVPRNRVCRVHRGSCILVDTQLRPLNKPSWRRSSSYYMLLRAVLWSLRLPGHIWGRREVNFNYPLPEFRLKGQCHEIFCIRFFSWITFVQAPDNNIRIISNFFEKFAEIFASQGAPPVSLTPVANCRRHQRHRRQICHRYQRHRRQILPPVPLVLLTPVANNGNNIRLQKPESEL